MKKTWRLKALKHSYWQIPLTIAFLCFGVLLVAQHRSHLAYSSSLEVQTEDTLSILALQFFDIQTDLQNEVLNLRQDLYYMENAIATGVSTAAVWEAQITDLQTALGVIPVTGPGISITITSESDLRALDLTDIINELFVSGAEAISINNERITMQTDIADRTRGFGSFGIAINDAPLLAPVVIRAIGDSATLEMGLVFPGGIADIFRLHQVHLLVRQEESLDIPAANRAPFSYARVPEVEIE
jgi:uncharacterized protein YlxW (UPF0749 family)